MKKIFFFLSILAVVSSCSNNEIEEVNNKDNGITFIGILDGSTKVTANEGVLSWTDQDKIGIFGNENNLPYTGSLAAGTMTFRADDASATSASTYYAFFPYTATYPYALKTYTVGGFDIYGDQTDVVANTNVTDKLYVPITVEQNQVAYTNETMTALTGKTNQSVFLSGTGVPSEGTTILNFKPLTGILELGLKGDAAIKEIFITLINEPAGVGQITGKGVVDLTTNIVTITNTAKYLRVYFRKTGETTNSSLQLNSEFQKVKLVVTDFMAAPEGLNLKITRADGKIIERQIWTSKTNEERKSYNDALGQRIRKHIYQPLSAINNADFEDDATYYSVNMSSVNFEDSYVYDVYADTAKIALVTKEYLGTTVNQQGIVAYPLTIANSPIITTALVAQVTKVGELGQYNTYTEPIGNIHGGLFSFSYDAEEVSYSCDYTVAGYSAPLSNIYIAVASDGSTSVLSTLPEGKIATPATISAKTLILSDRGDSYPYKIVKIGTQYWMAENLRTTKYKDGTNIAPKDENWSSASTNGDGYYYMGTSGIFNNSYYYNGYAIGHTITTAFSQDIITPDGWKVPFFTTSTNMGFRKLSVFFGHQLTISAAGSNVTGFSAVNVGYINDAGAETADDSVRYWDSKAYAVNQKGTVYWNTVDFADTQPFREYKRNAGTRGYPVRFVKENL